ncbi:signal-induced proliferation-associated 1-like protein 1 [Trichonephila clavipes]|nr:signal-induced proliferation-associated 1-like protein 1 [Trichonephila clavipes]
MGLVTPGAGTFWHTLAEGISLYPDSLFREWLLTKIVNGERASYSAPKFARMQDRTRSQMLEDIVTNLQNHVETGQIPKPYRRGSWRPIGHMRPSSPLLDGVRDTFEGFEQLARDFGRAFQNNRHLCDVIFNVGQGKEKTRVYAVRAILGVRSRVFLEMLYGFTTGYGPCMAAQGETSRKDSLLGSIKSSNFLQDSMQAKCQSCPRSGTEHFDGPIVLRKSQFPLRRIQYVIKKDQSHKLGVYHKNGLQKDSLKPIVTMCP